MRTLSILVFLFCNVGYSQNLNIQWSEDYDNNAKIQKIIGHDDQNQLHVLTQIGNQLQSEVYDLASLKRTTVNDYNLPQFRENDINLLDIILSPNGLVSIGFFFDKQENELKIMAFAHRDSTYHILMRIEQKQNNYFRYLIKQSDNKEKFCVAVLLNEKQNNEALTTISVFDNNFIKQSSKNINAELSTVTDAKNGTFNYKVNLKLKNDGSYATFVETDNLLYGKLPEKTVKIKVFDTEGLMVTQKEANLKKQRISAPYLKFDDRENLVHFYMFYSARDDRRYTHLIHIMDNQNSLEALHRDTIALPAELLPDSSSISPEFLINHSYVGPNGNLIFTAEERTYSIYTDSDDNFIENWSFGDIMIFSLSNNNEFVWIKRISKKQETEKLSTGVAQYRIAENFSANNPLNKPVSFYKWSYLPLFSVQELMILYNAPTEETNNNETLKSLRKASSFEASINLSTGRLHNQELNNNSEGYLIAPQVFYKLAPNKFIVWASDKKDANLGLVELVR